MSDPRATHRAIEAIWRIESAKVIATLTRLVRDVGLAEELAQDALVAALEQWPAEGVPDRPAAWWVTTAKRRGIDRIRHEQMQARKHAMLGHDLIEEVSTMPDFDAAVEDDIGDDLLRLIFIACHPVLSTDARLALTLKLLGGLSTDEIARAFLLPEPTIAQRIVRAKRTLTAAQVPFEVPQGAQREQRLASVLEVIYLLFNEGYAATSGDDWMRPDLCAEAQRLGRVLAGLAPDESEVLGLLALMELQASRTRARTTADGQPVLLPDQDRGRWDPLLIRLGLQALARAERLGGALGPYALQAAIAACHARARRAEDTDWARITALYDALMTVAPTPVVALNRAVAVAMAFGPEAGLALTDALRDEPALRHYHLLPAVRGDLLFRLGQRAAARQAFLDAAALTRNRREQDLMLARAADCDP